MSYVDGNSGSKHKALTGGVVAIIQVGIAFALVNGLAVKFFEKDPPKNLASQFFPTKPVTPDPVEPPKAQPEKAVVQDTRITAPKPKIDIVPIAPTTGVAIDDLPMTNGLDTGTKLIVGPVMPTEPPARFAPKSAKPRGNVAGWVTTQDYPTADIRAGHTGTVRFRLAIDASGRVTDCTITQSSGYAGLDDATCRNVTRRARFDSASDGMGEKTAGTYNGTIRWVIPND